MSNSERSINHQRRRLLLKLLRVFWAGCGGGIKWKRDRQIMRADDRHYSTVHDLPGVAWRSPLPQANRQKGALFLRLIKCALKRVRVSSGISCSSAGLARQGGTQEESAAKQWCGHVPYGSSRCMGWERGSRLPDLSLSQASAQNLQLQFWSKRWNFSSDLSGGTILRHNTPERLVKSSPNFCMPLNTVFFYCRL